MYSSKTVAMPMSKDSYTAAKTSADAQYKVAIEKCDALAGPAKDSCVGSAKAQYGKS